MKGNELLSKWIRPVSRHFWHSAAASERSEEKIRDNWMGVVHHVCGEHEWACSSCNHGPLLNEEPDDYLSKSDKCTEAFPEVVLDKKLLKSLPHYVLSRHTGCLESFNGMLLKYIPKRNAFEYDYFIARTRLAAIDHNYHLFRPYAFMKDGRMVHHRKFFKRTGTYSNCLAKV